MKVTKILVLFVCIAVLLVLNLFLGTVRIPVGEILTILTGGDAAEIPTNIILQSRLPQALTAIVAARHTAMMTASRREPAVFTLPIIPPLSMPRSLFPCPLLPCFAPYGRITTLLP